MSSLFNKKVFIFIIVLSFIFIILFFLFNFLANLKNERRLPTKNSYINLNNPSINYQTGQKNETKSINKQSSNITSEATNQTDYQNNLFPDARLSPLPTKVVTTAETRQKNLTQNINQENKTRDYKNISQSPTLIPQPQQNAQVNPSDNSLQALTELLKIFLNFSIFSAGNASYVNINISPTAALQQNNPQPSQPPPVQRTVAQSKLGVYIFSDYSAGAKQIVLAKPKVIKLMDPNGLLIQAVKDYKTVKPDGVALLRFYQGTQNKKYSLADDSLNSAQEFFYSVIKPGLDGLGENLKYFDYLETPNELDNTPGWESSANASWLGKFWTKLVELNSQTGIKTCLASIPVNNPPGGYNEIKDRMNTFLPALKKVQEAGGAFCYHGYTLNYTTDSNNELNASLRYRLIHQAMTEIDGSLSNLPFVISETGVDREGNPQTSGWQARGSQTDFTNWLKWYDGEINKDGYVLGATIFQIGDNYWSSFNIEPIAVWLAKYLQ